jgi:hypothetical protein
MLTSRSLQIAALEITYTSLSCFLWGLCPTASDFLNQQFSQLAFHTKKYEPMTSPILTCVVTLPFHCCLVSSLKGYKCLKSVFHLITWCVLNLPFFLSYRKCWNKHVFLHLFIFLPWRQASFRHMLRSEISGLKGIDLLNFPRQCQIVLQIYCTNFAFYQQHSFSFSRDSP